ncbi:MAG: serine hydrolase [Phormidesmis sp. FL-bin-119]|nr:serine hydrolase [Pedobacter sp.]
MNITRHYKKGILLLFLLVVINLSAQMLPDSTAKKIDKMFAKWNTTSSPGFTVGVVRNDSLIYAKGFGMANLEYAVPNSPTTVYHMASISKQFTAYSILLLAKQGKLKLDDDVRKYLSWFPDLKEKITIQHLLNHTSGIRDQWILASLSGTRLDDVITQDHIIKLLSRQQRLNFKPGEEYSYSNSNFTMLAEIVKSISGRSFRQFADSAIFKPLGMTSTHIHDDHTEIVANRSYSYRARGDTSKSIGNSNFTNAVLSYANAGATSLFTNVPDMSKWIMNFYAPKAGDNKDIAELTRNGILNNGKQIPYASGIIVDEYKGLKQYSHGGADAGFRTFITVFPSEKMGFIVFSNFADGNPGSKAYELVDEVLKDALLKGVSGDKIKLDSSLALLKDTTLVKGLMGDYMSDAGVRFSFSVKDQKLYWKSSVSTYLLAQTNKDTFVTFNNPPSKFVFTKSTDETIVDQYWPDNHRLLKKYTPATTDQKELDKLLKEYEGIYYSPEIDNKYTISLKDHQLTLGNNKSPDSKLSFITKDVFALGGFMFNVKRNNKSKITGFEIDSDRVKHLAYNKIE